MEIEEVLEELNLSVYAYEDGSFIPKHKGASLPMLKELVHITDTLEANKILHSVIEGQTIILV